eukprot:4334266-Pyramimonas_sp.AAC.1
MRHRAIICRAMMCRAMMCRAMICRRYPHPPPPPSPGSVAFLAHLMGWPPTSPPPSSNMCAIVPKT